MVFEYLLIIGAVLSVIALPLMLLYFVINSVMAIYYLAVNKKLNFKLFLIDSTLAILAFILCFSFTLVIFFCADTGCRFIPRESFQLEILFFLTSLMSLAAALWFTKRLICLFKSFSLSNSKHPAR